MNSSNQNYINKKLAPFIRHEKELKEEVDSLKQQLSQEEKLNDQYFNELTQAEKKLEELTRQAKKIQETTMERQAGVSEGDKNQNLDNQLEDKVKKLLNKFLLRESKKEQLETILMGEKQGEYFQTIQEEEDEGQKSKKNQFFILQIRIGEKTNAIEVPDTVKTFTDLREVIANYCMVNKNQVFFTDQLGNLLQFNMKILDALYPPVYDLLKNYEPLVGVEIMKPPKKEDVHISLANQREEIMPFLQKTIRVEKKRIEKIDWVKYLGYLSNCKYVFESILFLIMLVSFIFLQLNAEQFQESNQLFQGAKQSFILPSTFAEPIYGVSSILFRTIPSYNYTMQAHDLFPTQPLKQAILVQKLAVQKPFDQCKIYNADQRQMYIDKNQSCLNYDEEDKSQLTLNGTTNFTNFDPSIYSEQYGGYTWPINMTDQQAYLLNYNQMDQLGWPQYSQFNLKFVINYYNAPTNKVIQVKILIDVIFYDKLMNRNTLQISIFDLNEHDSLTIFLNQVLFYIAIVLLIFSVFDFFGIYLSNSTNNLIKLYNEVEKLDLRFKKNKIKNIPNNPDEEQEFAQKSLILGEYWVINFKILFLIIKKPLIFDYIYMMSFLAILVKGSIDELYMSAMKQIDITSFDYQDLDQLENPQLIMKIYAAILSQFLMISVVRFLGNWSSYLRCYGLVMIRFNQQSWFLLLVLIFIIAICAMSWIITLQGQLLGHTEFLYAFLGLLRCTLRYGMHNDIEAQDVYKSVADDISYSFPTRYIQYIIVIVIPIVMVPIFISLMTQQVHDTKQEAKEKMLEMEKQMEERLHTN